MEELEEEVCQKYKREKNQEKYKFRRSSTIPSNLSKGGDKNLSEIFSQTELTSVDPSLADVATLSHHCSLPSHTETR